MRKYTEEEFTEKLESLLGKESFYSGITNELANYPPFSQAKEVLVATKKEEVWARAFVHAISQHGQAKAVEMVEDNASIIEMFDWSSTVEGWQFWDYVNGVIV